MTRPRQLDAQQYADFGPQGRATRRSRRVPRHHRGWHRRPSAPVLAGGTRLTALAIAVVATGGLTLPAVWTPFDAAAAGHGRPPGVGSPAPRGGHGGGPPGVPAEAATGPAVLPAPAASWMAPVRAPVSSGFRTRQRPNHNGVDLAAPRGTVVHAAAAGTVEVARCDPATGFCDRDGGMDTAGCGWYVDILHADGLLTRYCHLLRRPTVAVGQRVSAGQPIGLVGASGNADGAHVHFEVHVPGVGGDGAVDPVPFFAKRGVRLGGA